MHNHAVAISLCSQWSPLFQIIREMMGERVHIMVVVFLMEMGCLNFIKYEFQFNCAYFIFQSITTFPELVKVLSHFCCNPDPDDQISFEAAVLLGRLCVSDENGKFKLKQSLEYNEDTHVKAKVNNNGCTKLTFTPI